MSVDAVLSKYKAVIANGYRNRPPVYYQTSFASLNRILGGNGFVGGKILQLLAEHKTGKTSLAADIIKNAQKLGKRCALIDYERSWNSDYTDSLGVDNTNLIRVVAPYMDDASVIAEELVQSGEIGVVVIDSIPAAMHSSEKEKEMTDKERMAGTAGDWTRHIKRLVPLADDTDTLIVLINQWRANTNPASPSERKPWGAKQIQYSSSYVLELVRVKNEEGKATVQVMLTKNKVAATEGFKTELILQHGMGFRADYDLLSVAIKLEIVNQKGAWLEYKGKKVAGKENATQQFDMAAIRQDVETYYSRTSVQKGN